jgi:AcrR family transcriptional regulator
VGLRERNAARTRELILDTALELFLDRGYDATTMEEIAEAAQIGTSTLYRYYPSKEVLVIEPLAIRGHMAAEFRSRPPEEPLGVALGHAICAFLVAPRANLEQVRKIRTIVDSAPGPRARLLEDFFNERTLLEQAVADRLARPADDLFCVTTARLATVVLELVGERGHDVSEDPAIAEQEILDIAHNVMDQLGLEPPVLPSTGR